MADSRSYLNQQWHNNNIKRWAHSVFFSIFGNLPVAFRIFQPLEGKFSRGIRTRDHDFEVGALTH